MVMGDQSMGPLKAISNPVSPPVKLQTSLDHLTDGSHLAEVKSFLAPQMVHMLHNQPESDMYVLCHKSTLTCDKPDLSVVKFHQESLQ